MLLIFFALQQASFDSFANQLRIFELNNSLAAPLVPTVEALLMEGETVSGYENKLILNASDKTISKVELLLSQLDRPTRNLLFKVRGSSVSGSQSQDIGMSGAIRHGQYRLDTGRPVTGGEGRTQIIHGGASVYSEHQIRTNTGNRDQQVRALEGSPAFIATGQIVPYTTSDYYGNTSTEFKDVYSGFYVSARLIGDDQVKLTISLSDDKLAESADGIIDSKKLDTTVSGKVGEWINLGGTRLEGRQEVSSLPGRNNIAIYEIGDISIQVLPEE